MKYNCINCVKMAIWCYPESEYWNGNIRYFCDDCVARGCSCNIVNGVEELDDKGRELPCCDYTYNEDGFDV